MGATAPVANGEAFYVSRDQPLSGAVLGNDSDANYDPLTAILVNGPSHGNLTLSPNGTFTYTPASGYSGPDSFTYKANDGAADSNVATVSLTVGPGATWTQGPPLAPVVTNPGSQTNAEGDAISLFVQAVDPNNYPPYYVAANLPPGLSINPTSGVISGAIGYDLAESFGGHYAPTVFVGDNHGGVTTVSFTWTITNTPRAPLLANPGNQTNARGDAVTLWLTASAPDGGDLSFGATGLPAGLAIDGIGTIYGTLDPAEALPGTPYTVTVTATSGGVSTSQTFTWTITLANNSLTLLPVDAQANAASDEVWLEPFASDPEGDALTWSASGLPAGLTIDPSTGVVSGTVAVGAAQSAPYAVTLTVSDGSTGSSTTFDWVVTPRLDLTGVLDQSNFEGDTVALQVQAGSGGTLTYTADGLPAGLSIDSATGLISGTISTGTAWSHGVEVTVSDGISTSSVTFSWLVRHVSNQAPTLGNPGDQTNRFWDEVSLALTASDPEGDFLSFTATGLPEGLDIDWQTGLITGSVDTEATAGTAYDVTITAEDGDGDTASQTFHWLINRSTLVAAQGATFLATEGQDSGAVMLATFTSGNPSWSAVDFTATIFWGDGTSDSGAVGATAGGFTVVGHHVYASPGDYSIRVIVEDPEGNSAEAQTTADVQKAPLTLSVGGQNGALSAPLTGRVATFTSGNSLRQASAFQATIDWGDGAASTPGEVRGANGSFGVWGSHQYTQAGTYVVKVTLVEDGLVVEATGSVVVKDIYAAEPATLTVASFTSADSQATASNFTAAINWGDGTATTAGQVSGENGLFQVSGTHIYAVAGDYTVWVTLNPTVGPQLPFTKWVSVVSRTVGNPLWALPALVLPAVQAPAKPTPQEKAISGVAKEAGVTDEAGPDVTDWFARDIVDQLEYRAQTISRLWRDALVRVPDNPSSYVLGADLQEFAYQAAYLLAPKWMDFGSPKEGRGVNTVVVHGRVLRKNILGNIEFGLISDLFAPYGFPNHPVRQAYITGAPIKYDSTGVSTYAGGHYWGKEGNFGEFAGKYRADNLAAFGVGHGIFTGLRNLNPPGGRIIDKIRDRASRGAKVILTKEEKTQLIKDIKQILKDILTNEAVLARRVNKYNDHLERKSGLKNVTIGVNALFFIAEHGGFNTESCKPNPLTKPYTSPLTSREYFTKVVKVDYDTYATKERTAGRTPQGLDAWLQEYRENYMVSKQKE